MKRLFVSMLIVLLLPVLAIASNPKVDLLLRYLQQTPSPKASIGKAVKNVGGASFVNVFIKTDDKDKTIESVENLGGKILFSLKTIIGAEIPMSSIDILAQNDEVVYIEADRLLTKKVNDARVAVKAKDVNELTPTGYTGKGVVVGVVDDGIDYEHEDFGGTSDTRFQYIEWSNSAGTSLGSCLKEDIDAGDCKLTPSQGVSGSSTFHGTHVTGIAAGSDATYKGMAPEADIVFYRSWGDGDSGGTMSTSVIAGVRTIFEKAEDLKQSAVANLSLGTSLGAHDGTSLLEEGLDELVDEFKPGRIIVNAAGNENTTSDLTALGFGGIHGSFILSDGDAEGFRAFAGPAYGGGDAGGMYFDVWLRSGTLDGCEISAYAFNDATSGNPTLGPASVATAWNAFETGTDSNQNSDLKITINTNGDADKPNALVTVEGITSNWSGYTYVVAVRGNGSGCVGDMWLYPDQTAYNILQDGIGGFTNATYSFDYANGDPFKTLTIPSTATDVIAVGAYFQAKPFGTTKSEWVDVNGTTQSGIPSGYGSDLGDMSGFSSLGPTASGASKPDVVAPGEPVVSTLASGYSATRSLVVEDGKHVVSNGTSMASPVVTGVVALLLEKNTCLTVSQVRSALKNSASTTGLIRAVGSDADNTYGAGKVNALGAIDLVDVPSTQCHKGGGNIEPDSGGGGCGGSIAPVTNSTAGLVASLFMLPALAMFIRRRKK